MTPDINALFWTPEFFRLDEHTIINPLQICAMQRQADGTFELQIAGMKNRAIQENHGSDLWHWLEERVL